MCYNGYAWVKILGETLSVHPLRRTLVHRPDHGFVLMVTLGMLALLSLLAVAYVTIAHTEAQSASSFVDTVKARMIALGGMEAAIARMRLATLDKPWDDPQDPWVYKNAAGTEVGAGLLFADATPSFHTGQMSAGFKSSGSVGGTHRQDGDFFVIKVLDAASQIYLNGNQPTLAATLDDLGRGIEAEWIKYGRPNPLDPIRGRGAQILAVRDSMGGFSSKRGLFAVPGFTTTDFERLRDYVSVEAWVDPTTVTATGAVGPENMPTVQTTPRAPVNLNTAPRAVLHAVLAGIQSSVANIDFALAGRIADEIITFRQYRTGNPLDLDQGPFLNWHQYYDWVERLTQPPYNLLTPEQAAVLKVHSNPNYTVNHLNPEAHVHHVVDKTNFLSPTTEFTFRSMGYYEITSLGRILDARGASIAEAQVRTVVRLYEQFIHTTQKDFAESRKSDYPDNTTLLANSLSDLAVDQACPYSGHVQLFTQSMKVQSPATLMFRQDFNQGYNAYAGDGTNLLRSTEKDSGMTPQLGSDLIHDGVYTGNRYWEHLAYSSAALPADMGTLEMWVKFDEQDDTLLQPFFYGTNPFTSEAGLQCILKGALVNGDLYLQATRYFYVTGDPAAYPVPYTWRKVETQVQIPKWGQVGEWHHIALEWFDGTDLRLFVDGYRVDLAKSAVTVRVPAANADGSIPVITGEAPYDDAFYLGGQPDGAGVLRCKNLTLDDVRIYADPAAYPILGFPPNDRFEHTDPIYVGLYSGTFPELPAGSRLGTLAWTEWLPKTYGGLPIADLEDGIDLDLDIKDKDKDKGDDDDDDGLTGGGGGGAPKPPKPPKVNKKNGGSVSDIGVPTVLVAGSAITYTIEWIIPVGMLPLNVTPIVDDIYLMYQGPVRFFSFEISED